MSKPSKLHGVKDESCTLNGYNKVQIKESKGEEKGFKMGLL
jgi:hypothetical protein